ncbi:MAG: ABC transporter substrate-binding protein, partial [Actinobacteria bacterium]|nr:ABC transporter substrate-binding protein [Actinomycetota bacterium]
MTALVMLAATACGTGSGGGSGGGSGPIQIWEGWTGAEAKTFAHLVKVYQQQHPGQKISTLYVNNDNTLQKVLTAVRGGSP